jgi:Na+/melibiose symporter-like transporter
VFSIHNVRIGNVLTLCGGVVITTPPFFLSLYLQQVLGHSALRTGLSLLPMVCVMSVGVLVSQKLIPMVGPRPLVVTGGLVSSAGLAWLAQLPTQADYVAHVLLPTLVVAAGTSVMMMPAVVAATTGVAPRNAGVASGLINMCRQLGAALGLAALVTVASTVTHKLRGRRRRLPHRVLHHRRDQRRHRPPLRLRSAARAAREHPAAAPLRGRVTKVSRHHT